MKTYCVRVHFVSFCDFIVKAKNKEEAKLQAMDMEDPQQLLDNCDKWPIDIEDIEEEP